jgi:hypothetical protein
MVENSNSVIDVEVSLPLRNINYSLSKDDLFYFHPNIRNHLTHFFRCRKLNYQLVPNYVERNSNRTIAVIVKAPNASGLRNKTRINNKNLPFLIN